MLKVCLLDIDDTLTTQREVISKYEHNLFQQKIGLNYYEEGLIPRIGYLDFGKFINQNFNKIIFWSSVSPKFQRGVGEVFGFNNFQTFGSENGLIGIGGDKYKYFPKLLHRGLVHKFDSFLWVEDSISFNSQSYLEKHNLENVHIGISRDESLLDLEYKIRQKLHLDITFNFLQE